LSDARFKLELCNGHAGPLDSERQLGHAEGIGKAFSLQSMGLKMSFHRGFAQDFLV
jgi:hypothetical protein